MNGRVGLVIAGAAAAAAFAAGLAAGSYPGLPPGAARVLENDWCHARSYAEARRAAAGHLTRDARRNLAAGLRAARTRPRGCALALRAVHHRREGLPRRPAWTRTGRHGTVCPRHPLPP